MLANEATASLAAQRLRAEEDMEANCAVCLQGDVFVGQQIVFCEYCNVAVHQQVCKITHKTFLVTSRPRVTQASFAAK